MNIIKVLTPITANQELHFCKSSNACCATFNGKILLSSYDKELYWIALPMNSFWSVEPDIGENTFLKVSGEWSNDKFYLQIENSAKESSERFFFKDTNLFDSHIKDKESVTIVIKLCKLLESMQVKDVRLVKIGSEDSNPNDVSKINEISFLEESSSIKKKSSS